MAGRGKMADLKTLTDVAQFMTGTTICALADGAAMPLKSYVEKFYSEFEHYVKKGDSSVQRAAVSV